MKEKIILASTSPRRNELAKTMGLDFEIIPSSFEEDMNQKISPKKLVIKLAFGKANDVAKKLNEGLVIGVDTIVVNKNKVLGKPKSEEEAYKMLRSFSGNSHQVLSGIAIIDCKTKKSIKAFESTKVYFKELSDKEIWSYINTREPMDKAGAYGIQDLSSIFIKKINGCYFNVVGFPVHLIYKSLQKFNVDIFDYERWQKKK